MSRFLFAEMKMYQTKIRKLSGSDFHEVRCRADIYYHEICGKTKRRPYIRSAYFNNEKIFLELFRFHLFDQENWRDRTRRLKYFPAALELIRKSRFEPTSKENPNNKTEILHRFGGLTRDNEAFYVQIKEEKRTGRKWIISIFPTGTEKDFPLSVVYKPRPKVFSQLQLIMGVFSCQAGLVVGVMEGLNNQGIERHGLQLGKIFKILVDKKRPGRTLLYLKIRNLKSKF